MSCRDIHLWGIRTNNLKNLDVVIRRGGINLIVGPSGSGKSSLAYDTIGQIGQHEYLTMCASDLPDATYKVDGYNGMLATVPLKQLCANTNTHSTIGTYFGLNRNIVQIFSTVLSKEDDFFVLNKASNLCPECNGLGVVRMLDVNKIVDPKIPIKDNPFRCWNRHKDFYAQMLELFCNSINIDSTKSFRQLSSIEQDKLLSGHSTEKFSVRYKRVNMLSRRTSAFWGVLTGKPMLPQFEIGEAYYSDVTCPMCNGHRYSPEHESLTVKGLSIGSLMTLQFQSLEPYLVRLEDEFSKEPFVDSIRRTLSFVRKANELNLKHLHLNRGIPTLSGGELQRLRLAQIFNTQLNDLLVILDEPLAGVSSKEKDSIYRNVIDLSKRHTVVIVDHGESFCKKAINIIALGEGGGKFGGNLIDVSKYFHRQKFTIAPRQPKRSTEERIRVSNNVYSYKGADVNIALGAMNLITGKSGIGKSILLKEYFPLHFDSYLYICQRQIMGGKQSSVATALDVAMPLAEFYAKRFSKPKQYFSKQIGCEGACTFCSGYGYLEYSGSGGLRVECKECNGSGFNPKLRKHTIQGLSLPDIWDLTIDEAYKVLDELGLKSTRILGEANDLLLNHLKLSQQTMSLSGGENIRIKLLRASHTREAVIGIDEPFRGLDKTEISKLIAYLYSLNEKDKTLIVIDHTEDVDIFFQKHYEVYVQDNVLKTREISVSTKT